MRYLLIILCLFTTPVLAQVFHPQTAMLSNGMQVVVLPQQRTPAIMHMVWYKVGSADDPFGKSGLAHFLEHLMFKGTAQNPEGAYSSTVARLGGENNAFTSYDFTAYYAKVGVEHLKTIMALEADRMANLGFNTHEVKTENSVIIKERGQRVDDDIMGRFAEQVQAAQFLPHPYGRPVIGWPDEMSGFTLADAQNFYRTWYAPNNAILVISGDTTLKQVLPLAQKTFGKIAAKKIPARTWAALPPKLGNINLQLKHQDVQQAVWQQHYIVPSATPQTILQSDALMVLADILGNGRTGLLNQVLVKQLKLASSAEAYYGATSLGPAGFSVVVVPQQGISQQHIEQAVAKILHTQLLPHITKESVAKSTTRLDLAAVFARDSLAGPAMQVGQALAQGLDLKTIEAWPARMKNVAVKDVQQAAKLLLSTPTVTSFAESEAK